MKNSKIEWTDHTWNPWIGCTKVSPGCANCYAEALDHRWGHDSWGPGAPRRRTSEANWKQPLKWNREASLFVKCRNGHRWQAKHVDDEGFCPECGDLESNSVRPRVFCASLADWLDDEVDIWWFIEAMDVIRRTPNLDWLVLTKRPQNFHSRLTKAIREFRGSMSLEHAYLKAWLTNMRDGWAGVTYSHPKVGRENYWIGTTVEDQTRADERIPELLKIPAKVRFLSCEPLLGPVNLDIGHPKWRTAESYHSEIHWVIAGCESGPKRRPMEIEWVMSLRNQCKTAGVAFFMKQMEIDGEVAHDGFPEDLDVKEFPST